MAFFRKSLSEDSIDRYSNTWAFIFFLFLFIVALFLPTSPSLAVGSQSGHTMHNSEQSKTSSATNGSQDDRPRYTASCWVPSGFSGSMVEYSNALCAQTLNSLVQGIPFQGASLWRLLSKVLPSHAGNHDQLTVEDFRPSAPKLPNNKSGSFDEDEEGDRRASLEILRNKRDEVESGIQQLISYRTPMFLFIFAICLRLPHMLWSLLSICFGSINVDQTLTTAQDGQSMDASQRHKLTQEVLLSLGKPTKKTGLLYLLMKLFMVIVVCVGVIVVSHTYLAEVDRLDKDLEDVRRLMNGNVSQLNDDHSSETQDSGTEMEDFYSHLYLCAFKIRNVQNIQSWTVQCSFTLDTNGPSGDGRRAADNQASVERHGTLVVATSEKNILLLYKALYTIVLAFLVVLALFNICSFLAWLFKLLVPSCWRQVGLNSNACVDVVFIVSMALNNASLLVAMEIAKYASGSGRNINDGESSKLNEANDEM